ncbi:hypothetical protein DAPPUDRAFT_120041 [Daphnia pulex]|uniref:Uncharacterized protein n=1 Tax=Daphnia pulex TaxID=6669 RepID=E9I052_DAPPU|nr:hypothetical protein DAPPUDRAFT_120041 [Daphnia pulex]|eukprot:EFX62628.1 hypothetical protein DAPPUDRAFT_120041 [Daphnia pulex]
MTRRRENYPETDCLHTYIKRGSGGFSPPFYPVDNQISFSPLHRGYFTSNQMRGQSNLQGFGPYYVDPTINYFPNFPNNPPPPISGSMMFGRQQPPSELNRQNSVLLDLQDLIAEIVDRPRGNLRQRRRLEVVKEDVRRRTVRQQGDDDEFGLATGPPTTIYDHLPPVEDELISGTRDVNNSEIVADFNTTSETGSEKQEAGSSGEKVRKTGKGFRHQTN